MSSAAMDTVESARTGRLLGFTVDFILLMIVTAIIWFVFTILQGVVGAGAMLAASGPETADAATSGMMAGASTAGLVLSVIMWAVIGVTLGAYFTYFTMNGGQTLGKRLTDVTVVSDDGSSPTRGQAIKRTAVLLAPLPIMAIVAIVSGYIPILGPLLGVPIVLGLMFGWLFVEAVVMFVSDDAKRLGDKAAGTAVVES